MKRLLTSETFLSICVSILLSIIIFLVFLWSTAPEQWYADSHDSKCESLLENSACHCYERFLGNSN